MDVTRQQVALRLDQRFPRVAFAEILTVVDGCWRDLDVASAASLPELVERLATQRLNDSTSPA